MKKLVIFILILIVLTGITIYYLYDRNIYSKEILKVEILGPGEAELAQEIEYIVKYKNNGDIRLEEPRLIFEYPKASLPEGGEPLRLEMVLDDIYPGQERTFNFKARILGQEGDVKTAKAWLSYRPKNLQARFESETTLNTRIISVPLTFEFDLPSRIESEKDFNFRINYFSNLDFPLDGLRVQVEYPKGFEFVKASPQALGKTEWDLSLLNPFQGGRIEIFGRLAGEVGDSKIFRAKIGFWQEGDFILLKEAVKGVVITRPSIYVRQEINSNPRYTAFPGDWLHYEIYFKNIGEEALTDLFLVSRLSGGTFDLESMRSDEGTVRPSDNSIVFDWRDVPKLKYLEPMEEGKVDFWVKLKTDLGNIKEPSFKNTVSIAQTREEFVTKVGSRLELVQRGYFYDEVFGNSGPIPPKVDQSTTYTVIWETKNYYSNVEDVKVRAVLPQNVNLTGKIFPIEEASKFAFDLASREITWSVGDLDRGSGVMNPDRSIAFQVSFVPDENQRGTTPNIINQIKIIGQDTWTDAYLEFLSPSINTSLPDDQRVEEQQGIVE